MFRQTCSLHTQQFKSFKQILKRTKRLAVNTEYSLKFMHGLISHDKKDMWKWKYVIAHAQYAFLATLRAEEILTFNYVKDGDINSP